MGGSSALLVVLLPLGFAMLPPGPYRFAALVSTCFYVAGVALAFGAPRLLDPIVHLGLPGVAIACAAPREAMRRCLAAPLTTVAVAVAVLVIVGLWAVMLIEKQLV